MREGARVASHAGEVPAIFLGKYGSYAGWLTDAVRAEVTALMTADNPLGVPLLVDFVDVDSAKWAEYAKHHAWPMSWLYRREGEQLLVHERAVATTVSPSSRTSPSRSSSSSTVRECTSCDSSRHSAS